MGFHNPDPGTQSVYVCKKFMQKLEFIRTKDIMESELQPEPEKRRYLMQKY
jgi:hypothetical protein